MLEHCKIILNLVSMLPDGIIGWQPHVVDPLAKVVQCGAHVVVKHDIHATLYPHNSTCSEHRTQQGFGDVVKHALKLVSMQQ